MLNNAISFKQNLNSGTPQIGTYISLASPQICEIFSNLDFDWLWLDLEHSAIDISSAEHILQACNVNTPCLVRTPNNDHVWLKRILDLGPSGVIVPMVNSAQAAKAAVDACRYPPLGNRSIGTGRASGYGLNIKEYLKNANEQLSVILQIEHIDAVNNINAIVTTTGIDAYFLGPFDLSASLGQMGNIDHPDVINCINIVQKACNKHNKPLGIYAANTQQAKIYIEMGFSFICVGQDSIFLQQAALKTLAELQ